MFDLGVSTSKGTHTLSMYYLERGGTLSNSMIQFNVPVEKMPQYSVTYNANGATSGTAPVDDNKYVKGAEVTVMSEGSLVRRGYKFIGWGLNSTDTVPTYKADDKFTMATDIELYALWELVPLKVTYNANGGIVDSVPVDSTVYTIDTLVSVKDTSVVGHSDSRYICTSWNTEPDGSGIGYKTGGSFKIQEDTVLYAQWEMNPVELDIPSTGRNDWWIYVAGFAVLGLGILGVFQRKIIKMIQD